MDKGKIKKEMRQQRQQEEARKKRNMRILVWSTAVVFVALIVVLAVFRPKPGAIDVSYDNLPTIGKTDAPVKILEIGDFKCPACAYFSQTIMPEIKKDYIDTGKVSVSFQTWNIISPDSDSYTASLAGRAIYHQSNDEFWKFYDAVFKNQPDEKITWATTDYLVDFAKQQGLKLDFDRLKTDIENRKYADEVDSFDQFASKHRFTSTPTVIINGRKLDENSSLDAASVKAAIDKALQEAQS